MKERGVASIWLLLFAAAAAAFIWVTSRQLPPLVASHFGAGGIANGFILHRRYVFAALFVCVAPALAIVFPVTLALRNPSARINLPNGDYWLAPERRAETVAFIRTQMMRFGTALLVFFCYVHWLVVKANESSPPRLAGASFVSAVAVFLGFLLVWIAIHYTRFRRPV
jgi:hypothetical protein